MAGVQRGDICRHWVCEGRLEQKSKRSQTPIFKAPLPVTRSGSRGKAPARRGAACEASTDRRAMRLLGNVSAEIELPDKNNLGRKKKN